MRRSMLPPARVVVALEKMTLAAATGRPVTESTSCPEMSPWVVCDEQRRRRKRSNRSAEMGRSCSSSKARWPHCRSKMQVTMKKKWRHWALCAVLAVGSALGASLLSDVRFFQILNLKAYDAHFIVRDFLALARPAISNIVLLTADKKALDTFPELRVFWNQHYANAIRAAGAGRRQSDRSRPGFRRSHRSVAAGCRRTAGRRYQHVSGSGGGRLRVRAQFQQAIAIHSGQHDGRGPGPGRLRQSNHRRRRFHPATRN